MYLTIKILDLQFFIFPITTPQAFHLDNSISMSYRLFASLNLAHSFLLSYLFDALSLFSRCEAISLVFFIFRFQHQFLSNCFLSLVKIMDFKLLTIFF